MGFWFFVLILLLIYLVIALVLRVIEDKNVKKSREEIPGKVSGHSTKTQLITDIWQSQSEAKKA